MTTSRFRTALTTVAICLLAISGALVPGPAQAAELASNGTFEFLTSSLPEGTTNAEYVARLITVNADGAVTFSVDVLPAGISLDTQSGFLTGRPTSTFNQTINVTADDGVQTPIVLAVGLRINSSGGGGNAGAEFGNASLAQGAVGTVYSETLTISNGVGPYVFGAKDLPPGISLNGSTGVLSGNPVAPGTYFATFSARDFGDGNNVATVLQLVVLPDASSFQFTTQFLNNGEVGTPFCDTYLTANGQGTVRFGAAGLPPGLVLDGETGEVSGTPTTAGTFEVDVFADDGSDTIATNLTMVIAPSASSNFYWDVFSLPAALLGESYSRQPPLEVAAVNGSTVTYAAQGLPPGILYNTSTGELTGTPTEVGEFDVEFTATDSTTTEVLTLVFEFVVLPATGGDIASIPVNFWIKQLKTKLGEDGSESWGGQLFFNSDRRAANTFDAQTDELEIAIGTDSMVVGPASFEGTSKSLKYKFAEEGQGTLGMQLSMAKQALKWKAGKMSLDLTLPSIPRVVFRLGGESFRMELNVDEKGGFKAPNGFRRPSFVLASGQLLVAGSAMGSAKLKMMLADLSLVYDAGVSTLRVRILDDSTVLLDRDFTALGEAKITTDKSGALLYKIKTASDVEVADTVKKFQYDSKKGQLKLDLLNLDIMSIQAGESHLTFEVTIGDRVYTTSATFFESSTGKFSTASMP